jgi:hypothetical protein
MKYTQFLVLEIGATCNLAAEHSQCPAHRRHDPVSAATAPLTPLTDDMIVHLATTAYWDHGFRGLVAFHFYNEPMVEADRMFSVMGRIRGRVPESRFLLWTNGSIRPNDPRTGMFEQIHCTDYNNLEEILRPYFEQFQPRVLSIFRPQFDGRVTHPTGMLHHTRCLRPLIELCIDHYGTAHLCCQDWRGDIPLGNVWTDGLAGVLVKRLAVLRTVCGPIMSVDAPQRCLHCNARTGVHAFDATIAREGELWSKTL